MTAPDHRPLPALHRPAPSAPSAPHAGPAAAARAFMAGLLALAGLAGLAAHAADRRTADRAEPLESLAAPIASRTWDLAFWSTHQTARTPLWSAALAFCLDKREAAFPACTAVRLATWWRPVGSDLPGVRLAGSYPAGVPAMVPAAGKGQSASPARVNRPATGHGGSAGRPAASAGNGEGADRPAEGDLRGSPAVAEVPPSAIPSSAQRPAAAPEARP